MSPARCRSPRLRQILAASQEELPQVFYAWDVWEEVEHNMWGKVADRAGTLEQAISFTGDHERYGHFMRRVVREWPVSCENAFTDPHLGHHSWVGHAACALAFRCPEDIVRQAWGYLTDEQKLLANKEADAAIEAWWVRYVESKGVERPMEGQMLLEWDT